MPLGAALECVVRRENDEEIRADLLDIFIRSCTLSWAHRVREFVKNVLSARLAEIADGGAAVSGKSVILKRALYMAEDDEGRSRPEAALTKRRKFHDIAEYPAFLNSGCFFEDSKFGVRLSAQGDSYLLG